MHSSVVYFYFFICSSDVYFIGFGMHPEHEYNSALTGVTCLFQDLSLFQLPGVAAANLLFSIDLNK